MTAARERKQRQPRTVILQTSNVRADEEVHRQIGLKDALHLADLHEALVISFGLSKELGSAPWYFSAVNDRESRLDAGDPVHRHLAAEGDAVAYHFGLWDIAIVAVESYPRDAGTPRALCIGGSGDFGGVEFDLAEINAELTGTATTREVLTATKAEVRELIDRSGIFDFVPLLQALDLTREVILPVPKVETLRGLPVENDRVGRDAFWTVMLAISCMSDDQLADEILESTMSSLGWENDDGTALTGAETRALCAESLRQLASVGGYGTDALSPVDRLDIYRELLRV
ncbi:hypothetical protein C5L39_10170 [Corynebacterium alimapuense]|uniref:Uncharacterized protein n=1 Tax=Corynebacterium alimapuense TaxID=1576874 RepID=A0A3M8K5A1_9CORY|nr:hypothetical protein C5L39_10170 [Corynebacterium alimapuense]